MTSPVCDVDTDGAMPRYSEELVGPTFFVTVAVKVTCPGADVAWTGLETVAAGAVGGDDVVPGFSRAVVGPLQAHFRVRRDDVVPDVEFGG